MSSIGSPSSLPAGEGSAEEPDALPPRNSIVTQAGDFIVTGDGKYIVTESGDEGDATDRPISVDSVDWTGLASKASQAHIVEIRRNVIALQQAIMQSDASIDAKTDACKRVEAVILLLEAPNVPWRQIVELLNHSSVTAFLTALNIIQFIIGLAS
ncbi:hypothetical protein [Sphingopyxis alaskensis]|jgi:hypothetical protein|uniref:Uncharacterized protein n=1 Tax=Sphingopyxis alaskensis (strain DSM 13593 / LMG 18877 / RB2256) TaxID=317655 RepID=Q1GUH1_SPHAL|nr:hypothetical protein [Sphingopyxis alaskensis]ABF52701.1 hypothetical protein Sala_0984 [Sphingopyxis alaskensis RB2256]MCM3418237.1 hypothetical protein [Sphingopyxis alaskensis]